MGGGRGSMLSLQAKRGSRRGPNFGPNVKKPTSWVKGGGGPDPLDQRPKAEDGEAAARE